MGLVDPEGGGIPRDGIAVEWVSVANMRVYPAFFPLTLLPFDFDLKSKGKGLPGRGGRVGIKRKFIAHPHLSARTGWRRERGSSNHAYWR